MNWYSIFYWLTVADGVKKFFDVFSNIFTALAAISMILYIIIMIYRASGEVSEHERDSVNFWVRNFRRLSLWSVILCVITWAGYVFVPSKKDCLVIVAGGAVGNFITKDTSARQIPTEVMTLLRTKIKSEIESVSITDAKDTLEAMTKEQLIEQLRKK
jgi:TRAP-type C4-dicarboxylate transport system permease large subunit